MTVSEKVIANVLKVDEPIITYSVTTDVFKLIADTLISNVFVFVADTVIANVVITGTKLQQMRTPLLTQMLS